MTLNILDIVPGLSDNKSLYTVQHTGQSRLSTHLILQIGNDDLIVVVVGVVFDLVVVVVDVAVVVVAAVVGTAVDGAAVGLLAPDLDHDGLLGCGELLQCPLLAPRDINAVNLQPINQSSVNKKYNKKHTRLKVSVVITTHFTLSNQSIISQ